MVRCLVKNNKQVLTGHMMLRVVMTLVQGCLAYAAVSTPASKISSSARQMNYAVSCTCQNVLCHRVSCIHRRPQQYPGDKLLMSQGLHGMSICIWIPVLILFCSLPYQLLLPERESYACLSQWLQNVAVSVYDFSLTGTALLDYNRCIQPAFGRS